MKSLALLLSLLLSSLHSSAGQLPEYKVLGYQKACDTGSSPAGREQAATWYFDKTLYIFGGYTPVNVQSSEFWKLDLKTWTWSFVSGQKTGEFAGSFGVKGIADKSNHPSGRRSAAFGTDSAKGLLYMFGGTTPQSTENKYLNDLWVYDVSESVWTWIAGSSDMNQVSSEVEGPGGRVFASGAVVNSKFYVFGGVGCDFYFCNNTLAELWEYSADYGNYALVSGGISAPTKRWSACLMPTIDNSLVLFGGIDDSLTNLNDVWRFSSGSWTVKASSGVDAPNGRYGHSCWASPTSESIFHIAGGSYYDSGAELFLNDLWSFDLSSGSWTNKQSFHELALVRSGTFEMNDNLFAYGGINEFSIKSETLQILCPSTANNTICDASSACDFVSVDVTTSPVTFAPTATTANLRKTIISGATVLALGFFLLLLRISLSRIYPNSRPEFLIAFVIGTCDFLTDLYFTIELSNSKDHIGLFYAAVVTLIISALSNLLIIRSIALKELQRNDPGADDLRKHLAERRFLWMIAVFMSSFNLQCFLLLSCGITQLFNCKISAEGIEKVKKWSMVGIFLEDIPQFIYQILHSLFLGTITPITIVSCIFTATSIFSGLVFSLLADIMVKSLKAKKKATKEEKEHSKTLVVSGPKAPRKEVTKDDPRYVPSLMMSSAEDIEESAVQHPSA